MPKAGYTLLFITITFLSSCYYDKADVLYPSALNCDTAAVSYNKDIVPLLQTQCYSCHDQSPANASGGIVMGTYASDKVIVLNGKLYGSVSHAAGYYPMPPGGPKMTLCMLATIKKWIDSGAPNN